MHAIRYSVVLLLSFFIISCATYDNKKNLELTGKAKLAMLLKKGIPSTNIKTHANNGVLQIVGFVNNKQEFDKVTQTVNEYLKHDTDRIINNIIIYPRKDDKKDEKILEKNVIGRFEQAKFPTENISVQARSGHVILSGFINKYLDVNTATILVKSVPGVIKVHNHLLYKK